MAFAKSRNSHIDWFQFEYNSNILINGYTQTPKELAMKDNDTIFWQQIAWSKKHTGKIVVFVRDESDGLSCPILTAASPQELCHLESNGIGIFSVHLQWEDNPKRFEGHH